MFYFTFLRYSFLYTAGKSFGNNLNFFFKNKSPYKWDIFVFFKDKITVTIEYLHLFWQKKMSLSIIRKYHISFSPLKLSTTLIICLPVIGIITNSFWIKKKTSYFPPAFFMHWNSSHSLFRFSLWRWRDFRRLRRSTYNFQNVVPFLTRGNCDII